MATCSNDILYSHAVMLSCVQCFMCTSTEAVTMSCVQNIGDATVGVQGKMVDSHGRVERVEFPLKFKGKMSCVCSVRLSNNVPHHSFNFRWSWGEKCLVCSVRFDKVLDWHTHGSLNFRWSWREKCLLCAVFVSIAVCCAVQLGTQPYWLFCQCLMAVTLFYCAHWQTYVSGEWIKLRLQKRTERLASLFNHI